MRFAHCISQICNPLMYWDLYNLNKKGTLGTTLTWFVAFIIIFVLMFTFIMATGWLALKKIFMVGGGNDIDIQGNTIQPISFKHAGPIGHVIDLVNRDIRAGLDLLDDVGEFFLDFLLKNIEMAKVPCEELDPKIPGPKGAVRKDHIGILYDEIN